MGGYAEGEEGEEEDTVLGEDAEFVVGAVAGGEEFEWGV